MNKLKGMKTLAVCLVCVLMCGALMTACSQEQKSTAPSPSQRTTSYDGAGLEGVNVVSMKGPTSIGLAYLMQNGWGNYTVCASADEVTPWLLQDKAQIVRIPANLAAALYNRTGGSIRVLDVNTLGVLYVVTGDLSIDSIGALSGHTVYMTGKGTVPEYTVRALLQASGLSESDVQLEFKSEPAEVAAILNNDSDAIGILPQPYATAVTMKTRNAKQTIDVTKAWEEATGGKRGQLVTGVTVAKADFVNAYTDMVNAYLEGAKVSAAYANEHPDQIAKTVVELGILENEQLAEQAIPLCNVVCYTGDEMKGALSGYLQTIYEQDPSSVGGTLPGDDFYYVPASK